MDSLKKVLTASIKETVSGKFWRFITGSSIAAIIGALFIGKSIFGLNTKDAFLWGGGVLLGIFILRFILIFFINIAKYFHHLYVDSTYGDTIIDLKNAYSKIHHLSKNEELSDSEFKTMMLFMCDTLRVIFERKTHAECSVSIKVPVKNKIQEDAVLKNLCRDSGHLNRDTTKYNETIHTIIGNTPFCYILNNVLKANKNGYHYVNNDIMSTSTYQNTSIDVYTDGILPYKSELVYPIIPMVGEYNMLGFICIDCNCKNKFTDTKYDIPMIEGVADGLYNILDKWNKIKKENSQK